MGKITTKILSQEEKGAVGQGSLRAERTPSIGKRKSPQSFRNDRGGKNYSGLLSQPLYFADEKGGP